MELHSKSGPHASRRRRLALAGPIALLLALGACDGMLEVENEQDILDVDLNTPGAMQPLVNGVAGDYAIAYSNSVAITGLFASELIHTGSFPTWREVEEGIGTRPSGTGNQMFNEASRALWVADDAVRRMREVLDDADTRPEVAEALIWGGFAHLILADNYCEVAIAGGPAIAPVAVYERAEGHFTEALGIATAANRPELVSRALAGRARTRLMLKNYAGAREDAARIPAGFRFVAQYSDNSTREYNTVANQTRTLTRREAGVHPRFYENPLYRADPRTPFIVRDAKTTGPDPTRQYVEQEKYQLRNTAIPIFSAQEARLIEAEAEIALGNLTRAVTLIDQVRASSSLAPYTGAVSADAVMAQLKYERSAELWLQGQHLNDLRRWNDPYLETRRNRCFEIGVHEYNSNSNLGGS